MKIAVVSESPADEAAIKILVDGILEAETELVSSPRLRPQGWRSVLGLLPIIIKHLHYQTDADAFVAVVDSDDSEVHLRAHEGLESAFPNCRLCRLRYLIRNEIDGLASVPARPLMKCAIGIAVPSVEAWYQCGIDTHVNEATWSRHLRSEQITYDRQSLKRAVYGSDRPTLAVEVRAAREASQRLMTNVDLLNQLFPDGFGALLRDVRGWADETIE
jgi:hypothetical protein